MAPRSKNLRVAVVGRVDASVVDGLRDLPGRVRIATWDDLYRDFDELREFAAEVLVLDGDALRNGDLGVLRLIRAEAPAGAVTLVAVDHHRRIEFEDVVRSAEARILPVPCTVASIASALGIGETPEPESPRGTPSSPSTLFDIARGVADEINNPLMFAEGHLQLLESTLEPGDERRSTCAAIRQGFDRVRETMEKVRTLGAIRELEAPFPHTSAAELEAGAFVRAAEAAAAGTVAFSFDPAVRDRSLRGSHDALTEALGTFVDIVLAITKASDHGEIRVSPLDDDIRVRARLTGSALAVWDGARSFDPYYVNRVLRGSPHGLGLYLVHAMVTALGGRTLAARSRGGELTIELQLKCER